MVIWSRKFILNPQLLINTYMPCQHLHATSAHPAHCIRNIPYSVGLHIMWNCSDRAPADHYFMDNLKAYKRYLLKCVYSSDNIDSNFIRAAKVKRSETLKSNKKVQKQNEERVYYFSPSYDPEFPNIMSAPMCHVSSPCLLYQEYTIFCRLAYHVELLRQSSSGPLFYG